MSSTLLLDQIRLMNEVYGEEAVGLAIGGLPLALRDEITELLPGGWCSTDAARELKYGVAAQVGKDPLVVQRRIVRLGIERTFTTVWRFFVRHVSDEGILKRAPILYSRSFNRGRLELVQFRPGEAELDLHGWPTIPEFDLVGLTSGIESVLAVSGRTDGRAETTRRGATLRLRVTWRGRGD
jgi:hypothetical protein